MGGFSGDPDGHVELVVNFVDVRIAARYNMQHEARSTTTNNKANRLRNWWWTLSKFA
jgi:hypothetical protein